MKTIADYQPHPLIDIAIDVLANLRDIGVHNDAIIVLVGQVSYELTGQGINREPGDAVAWIKQAIAAASER